MEKKPKNKIRAARQAAGLSQYQLAERVGCSQHHISRWENGERGPSAQSLKKLAKALGCKIDDLLF
jgi:transcriptional regulator with XRE-family HTH domain